MTDAADLRAELADLPRPLRVRLDAAGFDAERLLTLAASLQARARAPGDKRGGSTERDDRNRIRGVVDPPRPDDVVDAPAPQTAEHERLSAVGLEALRRGEVAFCVMAGGMATRMGGVVKALVEVLPGQTFLELRLNENAAWSRRATRPVPLWLMTSEATEGPIREALERVGAGPHIATFSQDLGLRLTSDGRLFRAQDGAPSTYATGHGDLPDALKRSGLLSAFVAGGGKFVWITNLDNLGATIDPALLGLFIERAAELMVEVTSKADDKGGIPVWTDAEDGHGGVVRRLQVLEEFRLPSGFDAAQVRVFNTNTLLVKAEALLRVQVRWSWFEVEKKVDERVAVQFERLIQELTAAMTAVYVRVPREGAVSRFLPVKDHDELNKRRDTIREVARQRGMLPQESK
ncbi:MAG: UTP--glucose-1-phosphate uridylyltransferase [Myxococcota bacterium]|nr:UTP--glucose-1-phosphate uridylyltransferase [Myxococcota bacterium]